MKILFGKKAKEYKEFEYWKMLNAVKERDALVHSSYKSVPLDLDELALMSSDHRLLTVIRWLASINKGLRPLGIDFAWIPENIFKNKNNIGVLFCQLYSTAGILLDRTRQKQVNTSKLEASPPRKHAGSVDMKLVRSTDN